MMVKTNMVPLEKVQVWVVGTVRDIRNAAFGVKPESATEEASGITTFSSVREILGLPSGRSIRDVLASR